MQEQKQIKSKSKANQKQIKSKSKANQKQIKSGIGIETKKVGSSPKTAPHSDNTKHKLSRLKRDIWHDFTPPARFRFETTFIPTLIPCGVYTASSRIPFLQFSVT